MQLQVGRGRRRRSQGAAAGSSSRCPEMIGVSSAALTDRSSLHLSADSSSRAAPCAGAIRGARGRLCSLQAVSSAICLCLCLCVSVFSSAARLCNPSILVPRVCCSPPRRRSLAYPGPRGEVVKNGGRSPALLSLGLTERAAAVFWAALASITVRLTAVMPSLTRCCSCRQSSASGAQWGM